MSRRIARLVLLGGLVVLLAGALPGVSSSSPSAVESAKATAAKCCTVTYNAAKTRVQVTGVVAFKGTPILFSFFAPCTSKAGPGLASIKSRWIPLRDLLAGYHRITIVQKVDGKIVTTFSPKFFIKGKAKRQKPTVKITAGPTGVVTATSVIFQFKNANAQRLTCRLDARPWTSCVTWVRYDKLGPGPHVFKVRAYSLYAKAYVEATRQFVVSAAPPG